ncbi:HAD domain-containing protein [Tenacibaculum maritimum]|uniref:HAD domain-containing protein n=1 Tax=Tenacibaculum maritimum TaxID=107401 RepID=UPI001E649936|nr:HAD domain-containing protein [Tenacibaculum maritimum]MCD9584774.1 hypothetical protein [Tenacibaculum maritimum]MCD9621612.1 hypothetical protein [Tenacibaculum maritimum]MCD9626821.1 hypothetical protein [Tenacibaculum maritimum]MCD9630481.1 hypothetical protein [Tenacibaculum maritimum]MCD9634300.1 hypothetical protein [Tenacibaculum maritimum]
MKIIFLDIDGVLNSRVWYNSNEYKTMGTSIKRYFDPKCVQLLNNITLETGAKIVVSSSWRVTRSLVQLQDLFKLIGITGKVYGKTQDLSLYETDSKNLRGLEIKDWITTNEKRIKSPIQYIILDDENGFLKEQKLFFFQTNPNIGLDISITKKIISFFD